MSIVSELRRTPLAKIADRLQIYEALVAEAEPLFELRGQRIDDACKAHVQNLVLYNLMHQECKTIEDYLSRKGEEIEADLHRHYLENSNRALGARDLQMYIKGDPKMVEVNSVLVEVAHVRRQLEAIVEGFQTMGWSLSNIVKLKVSEMDHTTL